MTGTSLGRLEQVELRQAWQNEAGDFTPWLAEENNLALLGETIGVELELEAQEKDVGPFKADILCKDTLTDHWVLVENQLERTDHVHLGQLLTYAAGLKAVTIVWIADRFTDEHRAALDWLNEITDDRFNFFGLEIELWRIGESPVAPKFNVICKPNEWSRNIAQQASSIESEGLTETKRMQLEFWIAFREYVEDRESRIKPTKPLPQHWMQLSLGRSGFALFAIASVIDSETGTFENHELRAELIVHGTGSKNRFAKLEQQREVVERELARNGSLTWHNPEGSRTCKTYLRRTANLHVHDSWPEYHAWLLEKLDALHRVFQPRIKQLSAANAEADDDLESNDV